MRRFAVAIFLLPVVVPADAFAVEPAERPPLRARLVACEAGATPAERFAVFTGSMPALAGATRMEMRFDLLQRHIGALGFARIPLPKWGQWEHTERRGIAGFIFTKRVEQLSAPASYRAAVRFRWLDAVGNVLRTARRVSASCHEQDPRPDLEVGRLSAAPDGRYLVEIVNDGLTDAAPFVMALETATTQVPGLPAGQRRIVAVAGERCAPGNAVHIALDTGDDVEEADELDDAVTRPCPFG
jgi:hypothetical protein